MKYLSTAVAFVSICMVLIFFYQDKKAQVAEPSVASTSQKASAEVVHVRSADPGVKENNEPVLIANQEMSERAQERVSTDFRKVRE